MPYLRFILLIPIFIGVHITSAQQMIYRTASGEIQITAVYNDSVVLAVSKELVVVLDYEKAEFLINLRMSTLHTEDEMLDSMLHAKNEIDQQKLPLVFCPKC